MIRVGWLMIALLACAVAAVIGAEWPRLSARFGNEARRRRERTKRKGQLKLLRTETEERDTVNSVMRRVLSAIKA